MLTLATESISSVASSLNSFLNFAVVNGDVQEYLKPIMYSLIGLAAVVSTFFLVTAGIEYMTSSGKPDKLDHAKKVLRNALVGLVIVIAAATLTSILTTAYNDAATTAIENIPSLTPVDTEDGDGGITAILIKSIVGLFKHIIETAASPFINALDYFTQSTPLMADNPAVFKLWLTVLGISNALLVLVIALLGFHVMSSATLGLDEIELKQMLPKIGATFLMMNISIFVIDAVIALSNVMISAVQNAYDSLSVWDALSGVASDAGGQGLVALLVMVVFMVLSAILLVYYVTRIVTLYIGAVLAPIVILLQIVPGFRDFTATAAKTYVTNIFVLFVHVVILTLAATLFEGLRAEGAEQPFDPVMAMIIGVAAVLTLLRTQNAMNNLAYVSIGPSSMRKMSKQFVSSVSHVGGKLGKGAKGAASSRKSSGNEIIIASPARNNTKGFK